MKAKHLTRLRTQNRICLEQVLISDFFYFFLTIYFLSNGSLSSLYCESKLLQDKVDLNHLRFPPFLDRTSGTGPHA